MTPPFRRFLFLLAGYWGLRIALLVTDFDQYAFPTYEMSPVGIIGVLAADGWHGISLANFFDNCGGHLLWGLATAPVFKVFGASYMALKVLPLLLGALDLWLIWDLSNRLFGKVAATVASLTFILAPPTLLIYSMLAKGNHFEGLTLQLLTTWFWVRGCENDKRRFLLWVLGALCAGLSIFAYSGSVIWVALLLLAHLVTRGLPNSREALAGGLGFAAGLTPLLWVNLQTGRLQNFVDRNLSSQPYVNRLIDLGHNHLLPGPGFQQASESGAQWLGFLWWLAYAVAWCVVSLFVVHVFRNAKRGSADRTKLGLLLPLLLYFPTFVLAYCSTDFRFRAHAGEMVVGEYRYLVPHLTFACLMFGASAQWALNYQGKIRRGYAVSLSPIVLGVLSILLMANFGRTELGAGLKYPAYDKADLARFLLRDGEFDSVSGEFAWDLERVRRELDEYHSTDQERIAFGLGREMLKVQGLHGEGRVLDLGRILLELPEELRPHAARGVGAAISQDKRYRAVLRKHLLDARTHHPEHAPSVAMGLSSFSRGALSRDTHIDFNRMDRPQRSIPYPLRAGWREGQGEFCGRLLATGFTEETRLVREFLPGVPQQNLADFWRGAERAWLSNGKQKSALDELRDQWRLDAAPLAGTPGE
jgi:hypothetical protein